MNNLNIGSALFGYSKSETETYIEKLKDEYMGKLRDKDMEIEALKATFESDMKTLRESDEAIISVLKSELAGLKGVAPEDIVVSVPCAEQTGSDETSKEGENSEELSEQVEQEIDGAEAPANSESGEVSEPAEIQQDSDTDDEPDIEVEIVEEPDSCPETSADEDDVISGDEFKKLCSAIACSDPSLAGEDFGETEANEAAPAAECGSAAGERAVPESVIPPETDAVRRIILEARIYADTIRAEADSLAEETVRKRAAMEAEIAEEREKRFAELEEETELERQKLKAGLDEEMAKMREEMFEVRMQLDGEIVAAKAQERERAEKMRKTLSNVAGSLRELFDGADSSGKALAEMLANPFESENSQEEQQD